MPIRTEPTLTIGGASASIAPGSAVGQLRERARFTVGVVEMWIQLLSPLVLIAGAGLLLRGIVIGRQPGAAAVPSVRERVVLWVAFLLALVPSLLLLVVPTYSGLSESASASGGASVTTTIRGTLLQATGLWGLVPVSLPVVLTAAGLAARSSAQRRFVIRAAAALLTVFVVLAGFSIGLVYLPSAAALWVAALSTPPADRAA